LDPGDGLSTSSILTTSGGPYFLYTAAFILQYCISIFNHAKVIKCHKRPGNPAENIKMIRQIILRTPQPAPHKCKPPGDEHNANPGISN
jgi:hypothetical protein